MNRDPLRQFLSLADASAGRALAHSRGLAARVRTEARRRARLKAMFTAVAMALVATAAVTIPLVRQSIRPPMSNITIVTPKPAGDGLEIARLRNAIAVLRREAEGREAAVAAMIQGEERGRRVPIRMIADPQERIRDQRELAALVLVRQADRQYRDLDRKGSATATYQRVVALFPRTAWADVARQRLVEMKG